MHRHGVTGIGLRVRGLRTNSENKTPRAAGNLSRRLRARPVKAVGLQVFERTDIYQAPAGLVIVVNAIVPFVSQVDVEEVGEFARGAPWMGASGGAYVVAVIGGAVVGCAAGVNVGGTVDG